MMVKRIQTAMTVLTWLTVTCCAAMIVLEYVLLLQGPGKSEEGPERVTAEV